MLDARLERNHDIDRYVHTSHFSDGSSDNKEATYLESRIARLEGIHIISLGIGDPFWLDMVELKHMASYPADTNVLQVDDFDSLSVLTNRIRDAICNSKLSCFLLQ